MLSSYSMYSLDARSFGTALSQGGVPKAATDLHMAELYHGGEGESTKRQLADALKVFDSFRDSSDELKELYPHPFNELGADVLCAPRMYAQLAHYMLFEYEKAGGGRLDDTTVLPYLRALLRKARDRFKPSGNAEVQMFFTCLDGCAPHGRAWSPGDRHRPPTAGGGAILPLLTPLWCPLAHSTAHGCTSVAFTHNGVAASPVCPKTSPL